MTRSSPLTSDSIAMRGAGVIQIVQPAKGHRFTIDSILLADFCRIRPRERVLEPGAGTGIVTLLLAKKFPRSLFYPVEVQQDLHDLCEENRRVNGMENVRSLRLDIRRMSSSDLPGHVDHIVANPPYVRAGAGRASPVAGRRVARQDLPAGIDSWLALSGFLKQGGRFSLVFPAGRVSELLPLLQARGLEPKRMRLVHPSLDRQASLALVESVRQGGRGLTVLPPLIVHGQDGFYSEEMKALYGGTVRS